MFDALTQQLDGIFKKLRSRGKLHPKQVDNAVAEMRTALLDADVSVEVADELLARVRERALSQEVMKSLTPAQQVIKVVREELQATMGGTQAAFSLPSARPAVVMLAGVQGSGKTTASAKLARILREKGKHPLLVAADLQRPAAVEQLFTLGEEIGVPVASDGTDPVKVAKAGVKKAEREGLDVVIVDTAGRLHVDEEMMKEARWVKDAIKPHHVLMVSDAMTGQDAVVQARAFMREVDTTGFILTKLDGDAAKEAAEKMATAQFTLEDFLVQMREMRKLGPLQDLLAMLPGIPGGKDALKDLAGQVDERQLARAEAVICSMTAEERRNPAIIGGSRRLRIARGSGTTTADVNSLLKEFDGARKMMRTMLGGKRGLKIPGLPGMPGNS